LLENCASTSLSFKIRPISLKNIAVHDPKLWHFFTQKLQKSVTIWEHLPKRYYFWTIIKQKRKKCDNLGCDTLRSWTLVQAKKRRHCLQVYQSSMDHPPVLSPNIFHTECLVVADYIYLAGYSMSIFYILVIPIFYLLISCFCWTSTVQTKFLNGILI